MNEQSVNFVVQDVKRVSHYSPTKFELTPSAGWLWLQRLCFWVLRKIDARSKEWTESVRSVTVHYQGFMQALAAQRGEILSQYAIEGKYLLMGPMEFAEFSTTSVFLQAAVGFTIPDAVYRKETDGRCFPYKTKTIVIDLNVIVLPWMKGMLVVPELPPYLKHERPQFTRDVDEDLQDVA